MQRCAVSKWILYGVCENIRVGKLVLKIFLVNFLVFFPQVPITGSKILKFIFGFCEKIYFYENLFFF